ncbi:MAG: anthranilate phosphoribosyltransferase [Planctomycetota bacterium]|jgi:anthranilate phosphoribosyltransferase
MSEPTAPSEFRRAENPADLTPTLRHLLEGHTLTAEETTAAFTAMMSGEVHHGEMGALLALLAIRTPTVEELLGAARVMRSNVDPVTSSISPEDLTDTAGTGGAPKTFNVSTAAAIIAAAAGARIAKHGNRSRTGRGSAEVLQALGVNVDADRSTQQRCLEEVGVCFCFAIHHHPATRHVMPVRLALGVPTIFNLLGPLTNPAGARRQIMGVYAARFVDPIANTLNALGSLRALVVHSDDGLDEISLSASTTVAHVKDGSISHERVEPAALGLAPAPHSAVVARDLEHAADMVRGVIDGRLTGPPLDMTLLNTAGTLIAAGKAASFEEGVRIARETIERGAAAATLAGLRECSNG